MTRVRQSGVDDAGASNEGEHAGKDGDGAGDELNALEYHDVFEHLPLVALIDEDETDEEDERLETQPKIHLRREENPPVRVAHLAEDGEIAGNFVVKVPTPRTVEEIDDETEHAAVFATSSRDEETLAVGGSVVDARAVQNLHANAEIAHELLLYVSDVHAQHVSNVVSNDGGHVAIGDG